MSHDDSYISKSFYFRLLEGGNLIFPDPNMLFYHANMHSAKFWNLIIF